MIEKDLAGPLGVIVKASTLRDYGVDNFFFLENKNTGTSQRNIVFIARGESARNAHAIAGMWAHRIITPSPSSLGSRVNSVELLPTRRSLVS